VSRSGDNAIGPRRLASNEARGVGAWMLYDVASSAYVLVIPAMGFSVYFRTYVVPDAAEADMLWGVAVALPLALAGVLAPLLGALFDHARDRRLPLAWLTLTCCVATAALWSVERGEVARAMLLFGVAHLAYVLAFSLYESWLPRVAPHGREGLVSGTAWGLGFVGSIACLALILPLMRGGLGEDNVASYRLAFLVTGAFFMLLGMPAVLRLARPESPLAGMGVRAAYRNVVATLVSWRSETTVARYLLAYYLLNDAIVTFVFFMAIFLKVTFGVTVEQLLWLTVLFHLVAIPATMAFGWLGDRIGLLPALNLTLAVWLGLILLMALGTGPHVPLALVLLLGLVIGSSQALLRAIYSRLIPPQHAAQYFGFQTLAGRLSAILGPLLFGVVSSATGNQRLAVLSLLVFMGLGAWLLGGLRAEIAAASRR